MNLDESDDSSQPNFLSMFVDNSNPTFEPFQADEDVHNPSHSRDEETSQCGDENEQREQILSDIPDDQMAEIN